MLFGRWDQSNSTPYAFRKTNPIVPNTLIEWQGNGVSGLIELEIFLWQVSEWVSEQADSILAKQLTDRRQENSKWWGNPPYQTSIFFCGMLWIWRTKQQEIIKKIFFKFLFSSKLFVVYGLSYIIFVADIYWDIYNKGLKGDFSYDRHT